MRPYPESTIRGLGTRSRRLLDNKAPPNDLIEIFGSPLVLFAGEAERFGADELMNGEAPFLTQLANARRNTQRCMEAVAQVRPVRIGNRDTVHADLPSEGEARPTRSVPEKPLRKGYPLTFAVIGREDLDDQIFQVPQMRISGLGGKVRLADAISSMIAFASVDARRFAGQRYHCGSKTGHVAATMVQPLEHLKVAWSARQSIANCAKSVAVG